MADKTDREDLLRKLPFWEHLSQIQKDLTLDNSQIINYKKGENIHSGNENCVGILVVKTGQLRAYMVSDEGKEITIYRMIPNEICIMSAACVIDTITFDVFIEAVEDSEILLINTAVYNRIFSENIYLEAFSYKVVSMRFSEVMWAMQQILFMSVDKRLAIFIHDELSHNNTDTLKLTHEEIAKYMGTAREVVSRMLKYFSGEGIVELSRGGIKVIDRKKLMNIIEK